MRLPPPALPSDTGFAADANSLSSLKFAAKNQSPEAIKAVAQQFEALFVNMVLKSMREATPQDGVFDNEQTKMFTTMLDQQLSQTLSQRGIGLSAALERQLSRNIPPDLNNSTSPPTSTSSPAPTQSLTKLDFQKKLLPYAEATSHASGIPIQFMLAQAALETGWGRHEIKAKNGQTSHNLFGIKADKNWKGERTEITSTEYINGVAHKKRESFRVYENYGVAFNDYAHLLKNNPRYNNVISNMKNSENFTNALQRAGYASDPEYANKLNAIIKNSLSV